MKNLLSAESSDTPSDSCKPSEVELKLPEWYDEEKFKRGQEYCVNNIFGMFTSKLAGLVAVFAIPSILKVLINTNKSSNDMTAYRRYISTIMHEQSWEKYPLEPGSVSWNSLRAVRIRHLKASKRHGTISQRDIALTQFGFMGFMLARPHLLGVEKPTEQEEEGFVHFWRTIVHLIGLQDRYNLCRDSVIESKKICDLCIDLVYRPGLTNVPEFFNHMTYQLMDGMWSFMPFLDAPSFMFFVKNLAGVPGYEYSHRERVVAKRRQLALLASEQADFNSNVDVTKKQKVSEVQEKPSEENLVPDEVKNIPGYQKLNAHSRFMLFVMCYVHRFLLNTVLGRFYFNFQISFSMFLIQYFPFLAYWRYGFRLGKVNMFTESIAEEASLKSNAELDIF